ncbi:MAG: T9SS type A sorting domain-containing protein [Bacteroidetes bacterium]|nr:T9SS type A sorting domain-containing protein [Bacteroidota bacterium]
MKKLFTFSLSLFLLGSVASAQSNTMVMVEEGTQASCGPCASQNPGFDALLAANDDKVVVLKYQTWWPGFDQMYLDNEAEVIARVNYYGFNGVPTGLVNGATIANDCGFYAGAPACLSQAEIDAAHAVISPLTMDISAEVVNGILLVTGSITADADLSGTLRLLIALTEQEIQYADVPGGTNGETEYYHVMKKFVGGTAGITLANFTSGDVYTINESLSLADVTIYDFDELEVVGWVQNNANKVIYQAAKDQDIEITSEYNNSAAAVQVNGLPSSMCIGTQTLTPVLKLSNQGNSELTSAVITYSINGGANQEYNWTGSLSTLGTENVTLDAYTFEAMSTNTIVATVSMPNGVADEDVISDDNTITEEFIAADAGQTLNIEILTDNYGSETTWVLRNENGTTVLSGGPYGNTTTYNASYTIPSGAGCYEFEIFDSFGDGICCGFGLGEYVLSDGNGDVLVMGGEFLDNTSENVSMSATVGLNESEFAGAVLIGPNPVNDVLNVRIDMASQEKVTLQVTNVLGQEVFNKNLGTLSGLFVTELDMSDFQSGVYMVNILAGKTSSMTKVSVIH